MKKRSCFVLLHINVGRLKKGWTEGDSVTVHSNIAVFSLGLTSLILYIKCRETGGQRSHIYKGTGNISDVHHLCKPGSKHVFFFFKFFFSIFICSFETMKWPYVTTVQWIKLFIEYWTHPHMFQSALQISLKPFTLIQWKKTYIHKPWKDLLVNQCW